MPVVWINIEQRKIWQMKSRISARKHCGSHVNNDHAQKGKVSIGYSSSIRGIFSAVVIAALSLGCCNLSRAALVVLEDFESEPTKFGWFLDNDMDGARYLRVEDNELFGSKALHYHLTNTPNGQQEAIGQMLEPVDMAPEDIQSATVQFDFYVSHAGAPMTKAFSFGIGSSSGTPLTDHNQMTAEGADDRSFNSYIGWQSDYCRIQYQLSVGPDGHGRGGTLVTTSNPGMSIYPETIGTARITLTKGGDGYDILIEYRSGSGEFVVGAAGTYAAISTSWDQVLFGHGIIRDVTEADIYIDNVMVYTNGDPTPGEQPARLEYRRQGKLLILTWPANAGWKLQMQSATRTAGIQTDQAKWSDVTDARDGSYEHTLSQSSDAAVFFRLAKP